MKITDLAVRIAEEEGKKESLSIAQIKEVLAIIERISGGTFYKIVKTFFVLAILVSCAGRAPAFAGGWHHHEGPAGPVGPQGPVGPKGDTGATGKAGADGVDGSDAALDTAVVGGVDVRLADGEHVALHAFDDYDMRSRHNHAVGLRLGVKLGESWESRQVREQGKRVDGLVAYFETELKKRDAEIGELKFKLQQHESVLSFKRGQ